MIRVLIPFHLRVLANVNGEICVDVDDVVTAGKIVDALETRYPMLRGAIRDQTTKQRRSLVRFYVCEQDWSHQDPDLELPASIAAGDELFLIVGALAGG